jgi:hypothetical protein
MPGANHDHQHAERRQGTQGADGHHEHHEHDHGEHGHGHRSGLLGRLTELVAPHSHDAAVAVDKGRSREAFGLVASLPASAALRVVFTLARTTAAFCAALVGCLARLGDLPSAIVSDNDAGIVASRAGGRVRLVEEVGSASWALVTAGKAWASMATVTCRYQAPYWRTW